MDYAYFPTPPPLSYNFYPESSKDGTPYAPHDDYPTDALAAFDDSAVFASFDPSISIDHSALQSSPLQSPPHSQHGPLLSQTVQQESSDPTEFLHDYEAMDMTASEAPQIDPTGGSGAQGSDEDKQTPELQAKRKAQNRAAQRAFRERKERHVQALKEQLNSTTAKMKNIETDFERLQRENQRLATQNEILRATSQPQSQPPPPRVPPPDREISPIPGPQRYSPSSAFQANLMSGIPQDHPPHQPDSAPPQSGRVTRDHRLDISATSGQRLLSMSAAWDVVQEHELFKRGQLNIHELCEKMKGFSTCNGHGPAFPEDALLEAIEDSVGGSGDDLL